MKETREEGTKEGTGRRRRCCWSTCVRCVISGSEEELEECSVFSSSSSLFLLLFLGGALSLLGRASLLQR